MKGYPVKTVFAMQFGGPQCKDDSSSSGGGSSSSGGGDSASSNSVPTTPSGVVSSAALGLFNKFHKKQEDCAASRGRAAPGMVQLFQMSTETVALRTDSIPGAVFEVPAGFKKVDKPAAP